MSRNIFTPAKPTQITLETLPQLFAYNRAVYGGLSMTSGTPENDPPERPEGVSEEEWNALGDPGRTAIAREREARQKAERELAASRARPAPPKKAATPPGPAKQEPAANDDPTNVDFKALIKEAVTEAVKPFQEAEEQRQAQDAANRVYDSVMNAAKQQFKDAEEAGGAARVFHNPANALSLIDLTQVVDENGTPDESKIKEHLGKLLKDQPHLGKLVDTRRVAAAGSGAGAGGASVPIGDRVKDVLAKMQSSNGLKVTANDN